MADHCLSVGVVRIMGLDLATEAQAIPGPTAGRPLASNLSVRSVPSDCQYLHIAMAFVSR
jgi:hypothetical protein